MKFKYHLYLLIAFLFLVTCNKENSQPVKNLQPVYGIGVEFKDYVDRFIVEAKNRGIIVNDSHLSVIYSDTIKVNCGYGSNTTKQVQFSRTCWQNNTDNSKEILMFHELGHALLGRVHDYITLPNGDYKSMMVGVALNNIYNEDAPERRKYYLDELFNPKTPAPTWSAAKTKPTIVFKDTISAASNSWIYTKLPNSSQQGALSTSVFLSPSSSLEIKSAVRSAQYANSYWSYVFTPEGINQSDKLVLTVNIKLESVTGGGVYFILKGESGLQNNFFESSTRIKGSTGFTEYSVTIPYYISTTKKIFVLFALDDQATGTANFDDITLTKYE